MVYLDCQNTSTALQSLAAACQLPVERLAQVVEAHQVDWDAGFGREEPEIAGLRGIFDELGLAIGDINFDGAYYFHGTRVLDPSLFREQGILPLGQMLDRIWDSLYGLIADLITDTDWRDHREKVEARIVEGNGVFQYVLKSGNALHHGPYALLTRDNHVNPAEGNHDYLAIPEIVEDIAQTWQPELQDRFRAASKPCIVKFLKEGSVHEDYVRGAFWYLHGMLHEGEVTRLSQLGFDCGGVAVPSSDIVDVEIIR
jgi:hypothetical protein